MIKNNKLYGYTLVEAVVVVVIIGIMVASFSVGLNYYVTMNAEKGLETLITTLDSARYETMARREDNVYLFLHRKNKYWYADIIKDTTTDKEYKVVDEKFNMYITHGDVTDTGENIKIYFNKGDGSLKEINYNKIDEGGGAFNTTYDTLSDLSISMDMTTKKLIIAPLTGRAVME